MNFRYSSAFRQNSVLTVGHGPVAIAPQRPVTVVVERPGAPGIQLLEPTFPSRNILANVVAVWEPWVAEINETLVRGGRPLPVDADAVFVEATWEPFVAEEIQDEWTCPTHNRVLVQFYNRILVDDLEIDDVFVAGVANELRVEYLKFKVGGKKKDRPEMYRVMREIRMLEDNYAIRYVELDSGI